jgi:tetratricopeptide (TPR) repeat protein
MYGKLYEDRARTRLLTGDLEGAERDAIAGGNLASAGTTDHARAHARLAQVLLARGRIAEALAMAAEALALRDRHGMMHDYEGDLVGLVHAEALHASGRLDEASAAITAAQARLMARVLGVRLEFRAGILALPEAARIVADFQAWT